MSQGGGECKAGKLSQHPWVMASLSGDGGVGVENVHGKLENLPDSQFYSRSALCYFQ